MRRLRVQMGMSGNGLAKAAGLAQSQVWDLEAGRTQNPTAPVLQALAGALGVTVDELLRDEGEGNAADSGRPPETARTLRDSLSHDKGTAGRQRERPSVERVRCRRCGFPMEERLCPRCGALAPREEE